MIGCGEVISLNDAHRLFLAGVAFGLILWLLVFGGWKNDA